jgi:CHAT domain-containing protein
VISLFWLQVTPKKVLSECEPWYGKIQKGEGVIGLTRALLYIGTKIIIVLLLQVADESISNIMVDFYKHSLTSKRQLSYFKAPRNAKLRMISEEKYAHPLFWSPFILIGR